MKRTTMLATSAGATLTASAVLAAAGIARWARRNPVTVPTEPFDLADLESPWGDLPCPPLREGVGYLHARLACEESNPTDVLDILRQQAPVRLVVDLLRDLQSDLQDAGYLRVSAQLHGAEQLLLQAAEQIGEVDYNEPANADGYPTE